MEIISINNSRVKDWVKLKDKKYRDKMGEFIVEGDHLVNEALKRGLVKEIIAIEESFEVNDIPFYKITENIMKKLSSQVTISKVIAVCKKITSREIMGNVILLDNIQDPGNLGTIIRSAVAFNIDTIIMSNDTVDLYNDKVIRASEGMIFSMNFIKEDIEEAIKKLQKNDYKIFGTWVSEGIPLKNISKTEKNGIIIGNEGAGMREILKNYCNELINIPINSNCESLNAGVAASIIMYEFGR